MLGADITETFSKRNSYLLYKSGTENSLKFKKAQEWKIATRTGEWLLQRYSEKDTNITINDDRRPKPKFDVLEALDSLKTPTSEKKSTMDADTPVLMNMKLKTAVQNIQRKVFDGVNAVISQSLGLKKVALTKAIVELGGHVLLSHTSSCTHYVYSGAKIVDKECTRAKSNNVHVVSPIWVEKVVYLLTFDISASN
jgi:hypothetical protein